MRMLIFTYICLLIASIIAPFNQSTYSTWTNLGCLFASSDFTSLNDVENIKASSIVSASMSEEKIKDTYLQRLTDENRLLHEQRYQSRRLKSMLNNKNENLNEVKTSTNDGHNKSNDNNNDDDGKGKSIITVSIEYDVVEKKSLVVCTGTFDMYKQSLPNFPSVICDVLVGKISFNYCTDCFEEIPDVFKYLQKINGTLEMAASSQHKSFPAFPNLEYVKILTIRDNLELKDTSGIQTIKTIESSLLIEGNKNLQTVEFPFLKEVKSLVIRGNEKLSEIITGPINTIGLLIISKCHALTKFTGFADIEKATGFISLEELTLSSIHFSKLKSVESSFFIKYHVGNVTFSFPQLSYIEGPFVIDSNNDNIIFDSLKQGSKFNGGLVVSNNKNIMSLSGLDLITTPSLNIQGNAKLIAIPNVSKYKKLSLVSLTTNPNLSGIVFKQLTEVTSILSTDINVASFPILTTVRHLRITGANNTNSITSFPALKTIKGVMSVIDTTALEDLSGLESIQYINSLSLVANKKLKSLAGLNYMPTQLDGFVELSGNDMLESLLPFFSSVSIVNGGFKLSENPNLSNSTFAAIKQSGSISLESITKPPIFSSLFLLNGNLTVTGCKFIDLDLLKQLTVIKGFVKITNNPNLISLSMPKLQSVGGYFSLAFNAALKDLKGLQSLKIIKGSLLVDGGMSKLTNFDGLDNLETVGDIILNYLSIVSLDGFTSLTTVAGDFRVSSCNYFSPFAKNEFPKLKKVGGNLYLYGNNLQYLEIPNLASTKRIDIIYNDLTALVAPLLTSTNDIYIASNSFMGNVSFGNLVEAGAVTIYENDAIKSFFAPKLVKVRTLSIGGNSELEYLNFQSLTTIDDYFELSSGNNKLTSIDDVFNKLTHIKSIYFRYTELRGLHKFGSIKSIEGEIDFYANTELRNLTAFFQLQSVGLDFSLSFLSKLEIINFNNLKSVGTALRINNNPIKNADWLSKLQTAGGGISFNQNDLMESVILNSLTSVGSYLSIIGEKITKISFPKLKSIDGYLEISYCTRLVDFTGFNSIESIHDELRLVRNDAAVMDNSFVNLVTLNSLYLGSLPYESNIPKSLGKVKIIEKEVTLFNITTVPLNLFQGLISIGGLSVRNGKIKDINLNFVKVNGIVDIQYNSLLESVLLSSASLGSVTISSNPKLQTISISSLKSISGPLSIETNPRCKTIQFNSLESVGGDMILNILAVDQYLDSFQSLKSIGGDLRISGSQGNITSIVDGFDQLETVGKSLTFGYLEYYQYLLVKGITKITGFSKLRKVGFNIVIEGLIDLETVENFAPRLAEVRNIAIKSNENLHKIDAFPSLGNLILASIEGNPKLVDMSILSKQKSLKILQVSSNSRLTTFKDSFSSLTDIKALGIKGNMAIENIAFDMLKSVNGSINIQGNNNLASFSFNSLQNLGDDFVISKNAKLQNFDLTKLKAIPGELKIEYCSSVKDLLGFSSLESIGKRLRIYRNIKLEYLIGLSKVSKIGGKVEIISNNNLLSLKGLENVKSILSVVLVDLPSLTSLIGLHPSIEIRSKLTIDAITKLTTIDAFKNMTRFLGGVEIRGNSQLSSLGELSSLKLIANHLVIDNNPNLKSFNELENLVTVGEGLIISRNPLITSLSGLSNVENIGRLLSIVDNDQLSTLSGLNTFKGSELTKIIIKGNGKLQSLAGLEKIRFADSIEISENDMMKTFKGLDKLSLVKTSINIDCYLQKKVTSIAIGDPFGDLSHPDVFMSNCEHVKGLKWNSVETFLKRVCNKKYLKTISWCGCQDCQDDQYEQYSNTYGY